MNPRRNASTQTLPNLYGLDRAGLERWVERYGVPRFHAGQVYRWLYARGQLAPQDWTDLPKPLRTRLSREARVDAGRIEDRVEAADRTVKYRICLSDGLSIESVHMQQSGRVTLCISSQIGCALDCDFCLTGKMGLKRHLSAGEILGQVELMRRDRDLAGEPFNIVFMGMGEPLHNYDAVMAAFGVLSDPDGFGLSRKRITVSTSGLAPAIERLAGEPSRPRLAVSLNAATDEVRERIMPINRKYPIARLLEACRYYAYTTGERLTIEYVLLAGINDRMLDIDRLGRIVRDLPAKLNLIPFNAVEGRLDYRPPTRERVLRLRDRLLTAKVAASVRWSRGADARAACGQLALLDDSPPGERWREES
jgi:23S rRNA (adenine2503-C2)-methyltransferase